MLNLVSRGYQAPIFFRPSLFCFVVLSLTLGTVWAHTAMHSLGSSPLRPCPAPGSWLCVESIAGAGVRWMGPSPGGFPFGPSEIVDYHMEIPGRPAAGRLLTGAAGTVMNLCSHFPAKTCQLLHGNCGVLMLLVLRKIQSGF